MADNDWQSRIKTGRNDECLCGSGKKYKKCHLEADEKAQSVALAKTNAEAAAKVKAEDHDHDHDHPHDHPHDHHKHEKGGPARPHTSTTTARQVSAPRKVGSS
ncbi:MAG TPA: SEC-C metal-binding domain-containing protein [bacterium]|nr:SEC-C metal-binding domain-containing protein [bacterium]